ncbi:MAG TPA: CPBP family intramembrane glutamic endopeptidase [Thermoanaerobaculia bacterium]|jgi:membrane protease YdiL (CAAX protease family)|nr:CPBP family intramembrane glutamic endopeptidase [Thermoanaerobaculia bacterium]
MGGLDPQDGIDGSVAAEASTPPTPPPPPAPPRFGAAYAVVAFVLFTFAQLAAGMAVAMVAVIVAAVQGKSIGDQQVMTAAVNDSVVIGIVVGLLASTAVALLMTRPIVRARLGAGVGLIRASRRQTLLAFAAGVAVALAYAVLSRLVPTEWQGGPLAKLIKEQWLAKYILTFAAVVYAPPIEELLFRGLMLRGMIVSWGTRAAGTVVTLLFVLLHIFEVIGYWPALGAIVALSLLTLFARLRSQSLVPAIAAHLGYNLITAALLFIPSS